MIWSRVAEVKAESCDGTLHGRCISVRASGGVFLITPAPDKRRERQTAETVARGAGRSEIAVTIATKSGAAIRPVVPIHVEISDPAGRAAEFSGYYGAKDGRTELTLDFAANDTPGVWQIRVRELSLRPDHGALRAPPQRGGESLAAAGGATPIDRFLGTRNSLVGEIGTTSTAGFSVRLLGVPDLAKLTNVTRTITYTARYGCKLSICFCRSCPGGARSPASGRRGVFRHARRVA